ncbi:MAG: hypothetical protein ACRDQX_14775 [Pseudonocardiaceae bacterium]
MADLQVRGEVLADLGSRLARVSERLSGACNALRALDASSLGAPPLVGAVHDFADGWRYGITQIGARADGVVRELGRVDTAFDQCDAAVAACCRPAGGEH